MPRNVDLRRISITVDQSGNPLQLTLFAYDIEKELLGFTTTAAEPFDSIEVAARKCLELHTEQLLFW